VTAPTADPGAIRLQVARGRDGRAWELVGRVEPLPGCAADVAPGYRLSLLARPRDGGQDVAVLRVSPSATYRTWTEAAEALRLLAAEMAADFARTP
jgi:hypothetical protein